MTGTRLTAAFDLLAIGRLADAHEILQEVLRADPRSAYALCALSSYHQVAGDPAAALAAADDAVAADPRLALAHHQRARALLSQFQVVEAHEAAERMVRLDPASPLAHRLHAETLRLTGRPTEALRAVDEAMRLDPTSADNYAELARIHAAMGNRAGLLAAAREGRRLDPQATWPVEQLANADEQRLRHASAARAYRSLSRAHPGEPRWAEAIDQALSLRQMAWTGLAAIPAFTALGMYVADAPPGRRAAVTAGLLGAWVLGWAITGRGLNRTWWRLVRRGEAHQGLFAFATGTLLGSAALFGFVPGRVPWPLLVLLAPFFVVALWPAFALGQLTLDGYRWRARGRRDLRRGAAPATRAWSPGSSAPPPLPADLRPRDTPAPPAG
jgi:tetratricopeptide (TPR) repeat protein